MRHGTIRISYNVWILQQHVPVSKTRSLTILVHQEKNEHRMSLMQGCCVMFSVCLGVWNHHGGVPASCWPQLWWSRPSGYRSPTQPLPCPLEKQKYTHTGVSCPPLAESFQKEKQQRTDTARPESLTLGAVGPDDAHGADPVGGDLGHQRVEHLQAGGIHHQDLWVVAVTEQPAFPLRADGELIELQSQHNEKESAKAGKSGKLNGSGRKTKIHQHKTHTHTHLTLRITLFYYHLFRAVGLTHQLDSLIYYTSNQRQKN